jgi:hypothetical protein
VSRKPWAGKFSGAVDPAMASARIGSAFGLAWAAAIGAAPRMISPTAAIEAKVRKLAAATERRTEVGRTRSRQLADAVALAGSVAVAGAGVRAR